MSATGKQTVPLAEGLVLGALTDRGRTVHAGRVNLVESWRAYSMSPQCLRYRKANGERLASHERGEYPMLVRRLDRPFEEYVTGVAPLYGRTVCSSCRSVLAAEAQR
ncbi:hypothetical protein ABT341_00445 [Pseudonocardia alni]|uniref:hypothetical protein n=1 Tax=Pseudonocardia alni TaxID=33907 RepID=UPI00331C588E